MQCAAHPQVETELRCGRCETPICPKCMVQTPVGSRCRACARLRRAPMYELSAAHYGRAAGAAAVIAVGGGLAWALFTLALPFGFGFFLFILAGAFGYAAAEVMDRLTKGKRGLAVQALAVAGVAGAYVVRNVAVAQAPVLVGDFGGYLALILAAVVAVINLR